MKNNTKKRKPDIQNQLADQIMSQEMISVSKYLKKLKFQKRLLGADEADVWRKIEKLCEMYEYAIEVERSRADKAQKQLEVLRGRLREREVQQPAFEETTGQEVDHG